jgi:hypothetical protein
MIKRDCTKYLTGETPSSWVWDKVHTVRQLGTKRFPEGVLLMNIYSWVCEECLVQAGQETQEATDKASDNKAQAQEASATGKSAADKAAAQKTGTDKTVAPKEEPQAQAQAEEAKAEEAKAVVPSEEAKAEEPKAETEPAPAEKAVADVVEQKIAQGDSIHSKQNFTHNYDRFTIGVRGGAASLLHNAEKGNWTCGGDVVLDLQYAHYWAKDGRPVDLGVIVGLGVGYSNSGLRVDRDSTAFPKDGVDYTVVAKGVKETDHQILLEVPLMFSLIHESGVFFNVGPKFMMPVYSTYKQTVNQKETHITAYFPDAGVSIIDNPVTGVYEGQQPKSKNGIAFSLNVMLTAEIGYEWVLKSGNSLGLGAFANYSVFNTYKNTTSKESLFHLTTPTETSAASLDVLSATKTYTDKLGYFDVGIKLAYHFNFPKKMYYRSSKLY